VVLVAIAVIGGLVLLIAGGGGGSSGSKEPAPVSGLLNHTVVDPHAGISVRRPANWTVTKKLGVINIQSHDRCLVMTLSAPVPADKANGLRQDGIKLLKSTYKNAKVHSAPRGSLGGIPTTTNTVTVTTSKGTHVRVLLSVGKGRKNAYLTEVVVRDTSCQGDLQLASLMLGSISFTK
jgi:hypothetical protein